MCDVATQKILNKIVLDLIKDRKIFTAVNVSRIAQKDYGVSLRHNQMKNEVHYNYANGNMAYDDNGSVETYHRRLLPISNAPAEAWVYYPSNVNPDNYDLSKLLDGAVDTKDAASTQNASANPPQPSVVLSKVAGTGIYSVDKRNRLWVPREIVKSIGLKSGDLLDVVVDGQSLVLTAKGQSSKVPFTTYKVDAKGNVAISPKVFQSAGINSFKYDILTINGQVVIKV